MLRTERQYMTTKWATHVMTIRCDGNYVGCKTQPYTNYTHKKKICNSCIFKCTSTPHMYIISTVICAEKTYIFYWMKFFILQTFMHLLIHILFLFYYYMLLKYTEFVSIFKLYLHIIFIKYMYELYIWTYCTYRKNYLN